MSVGRRRENEPALWPKGGVMTSHFRYDLPMSVDLIIVGQGLAGSLLAWRLIQRGVRVVVVDNNHHYAASRAAAGLINPVTGKRLVKTVGVDHLLPAALECYRELEVQFGVELYHSVPMVRLFASEDERAAWHKRSLDPAYSGWIGERLEAEGLPSGINGLLGGYIQPQSGYLNTNVLMSVVRSWLLEQDALIEAEIDYSEIEVGQQGVVWRDLSAQRLIFCEGYRVVDNPWFSRLPLQPAKGEIMTLKPQQQNMDKMINGGKWLIPLHDGQWRLGASYDREQLNEQPTEAGRELLLSALNGLLVSPPAVEVVAHRAGVRPGTRDKAPLLGVHPQQSRLYCFNGFGSKGSLLIPWYSKQMAAYLLEGEALPEEADIARLGEPLG